MNVVHTGKAALPGLREHAWAAEWPLNECDSAHNFDVSWNQKLAYCCEMDKLTLILRLGHE